MRKTIIYLLCGVGVGAIIFFIGLPNANTNFTICGIGLVIYVLSSFLCALVSGTSLMKFFNYEASSGASGCILFPLYIFIYPFIGITLGLAGWVFALSKLGTLPKEPNSSAVPRFAKKFAEMIHVNGGRDLEAMTVAELRDYAKEHDISIPSGVVAKADIIDVVSQRYNKEMKTKRIKTILIITGVLALSIGFMVWLFVYRGRINLMGATVKHDHIEERFEKVMERAIDNEDIRIKKAFYDRHRDIYVYVTSEFDSLSDEEKIDVFKSFIDQSDYGTYEFKEERIGSWYLSFDSLFIVANHKYRLKNNCLDEDEKLMYEFKDETDTDSSYDDDDYDSSSDYSGGSSGSGSSSSRICPNCHGSGSTTTYATNDPWEEPTVITCPMCNGTGRVTD